MDLQLDGKLALASGSMAGIGYAIARTLAQEGASVVVNGRTQAGVDEAVDRLLAETQGSASSSPRPSKTFAMKTGSASSRSRS